MKPSEMGLHSKVRWEINISGDTPKEHAKNIALFAEELYKFIYKYNHGGQLPELVLVTQKFARFVSKAFCFSGYSDEDVFKFIDKYNDAMRK